MGFNNHRVHYFVDAIWPQEVHEEKT